MSGTLVKKLIQSTVTYLGSPGQPGDPGSPYVPGHYGYKTETVDHPAGFVRTYPDKKQYLPNGSFILVPNYTSWGPAYTTTSSSLVWIPAQPARPPIPAIAGTSDRTDHLVNAGWTGGGRSVDIMVEGGTFLFTVPQAVAVVVGLVESDQTTSPNEALHAFYINRDVIYLRERGVNVFTSPTYPHVASNVYGIGRSGNSINYTINGAIIYSSTSKSALPLMLDASLYLAGDTVVLQELSPSTSGYIDGSFEPLVGLLGLTSYMQIDGRFSLVSGDLVGRPQAALDGYFSPILGLMGRQDYAQIEGDLLPIDGSIESIGMVLSVCVLDGEFSPMVGALVNSVLVSGTIDGYFSPMIGRLATGSYAEIDGSFEKIEANLYIPERNDEVILFSGILLADSVELSSMLTISFSSGFAVLSTTTAHELLTMEMQSALASGMTATLQSLHSMSLQSAMGLASSNTSNSYIGGQRSATAWVTNLDTGAVSMYAGFDFDRMYELDGKYYGVRDNSTYLLDGDTDDGAPIDAFVAFGKQNFGTSALKRVPNFYAGISSTGVLLLRVSTGAETYTYMPRRTDAINKTQRYDLGKGLKATYYEFELFNQAGCDFELDSVEFLALPSGRRI